MNTADNPLNALNFSGGPGVLPQITRRDQGYKGTIYQTHGVATDDFIRLGGEAGCKEAGRLRLEGKDYVVQEGDILHFRFNV